MKIRAFLLGFFATGSQVLLLRELVSSLNGSELFIGTAMFGWLIWVAIGAWIGGATRKPASTTMLFVSGALALPASVVVARLTPLLVSGVVGELIPFSTAALISVIIVAPVGMIAGSLFPAIARSEHSRPEAIVIVYLWEGVGAFASGVLITLLAGEIMSTLALSITIGLAVIAGAISLLSRRGTLAVAGAVVIAILAAVALEAIAPDIDVLIDQSKYHAYTVELSLETPYSRQTLLSRDSSLVLLTDNNVEAQYPDLETAENLLIPPLIYHPDARRILYIGRPEFGVFQLSRQFPNLKLTALDPRQGLDFALDSALLPSDTVERITNDPARYFSSTSVDQRYDIIIVGPSDFSNYRSSREISSGFLLKLKDHLATNGLLYLPTHFDSDRYVTAEASMLLGAIHNVLRECFGHVVVWPGNLTLFLATDSERIELPFDSILARTLSLPYHPQYISENYLQDRLSSFKLDRLKQAISAVTLDNSFNHPSLPYYQALYRAKANSLDRTLLNSILAGPSWLIGLAVLVILAVIAVARSHRSNSVPLLIYFSAGAASLTLELVSFYVFQVTAGALYSDMAALIGAFMLGLAVGTYFTHRSAQAGIEYGALILLVAAAAIFATTCRSIPIGLALVYHSLFLFTVAVATGTLFVAATLRYYRWRDSRNPGTGYAWELVGSSLGALLPMTVLLPVVGFGWLMAIVILLCVLTVAAAV
ncbi:MAG TPA: hypothetical protein VMS71_04970, partial [Candidatus Acidoferrum sp.]|nr:hypothetical protein [Candidatus Acidoferrum sp.]